MKHTRVFVWDWDRPNSNECLYVFKNRIRTSHDAAPYAPCCASHWTCHCTDLLTVWSLWGNPGMARCRKKSALAFGYIPKTILNFAQEWALHVYSVANFVASWLKWLQMILNDFSWFIRHIETHLESFQSIWSHLSHEATILAIL